MKLLRNKQYNDPKNSYYKSLDNAVFPLAIFKLIFEFCDKTTARNLADTCKLLQVYYETEIDNIIENTLYSYLENTNKKKKPRDGYTDEQLNELVANFQLCLT